MQNETPSSSSAMEQTMRKRMHGTQETLTLMAPELKTFEDVNGKSGFYTAEVLWQVKRT
jgi:hypothetical protein